MLSFVSRLVLFIVFISAAPVPRLLRRAGSPYARPIDGGGQQLNFAGKGGGEPLNVIISAQSDPKVLTDSGFLNWVQSVGLSTECLGMHQGAPMAADLGDGHGKVNQTVEYREDYGIEFLNLGTCIESLRGGNHLRMYRQNGPNANTSALFLAVSREEDVFQHHTISKDGYNSGRDTLVKSATEKNTTHGGVTYFTTQQNVTDLLQPGAAGINHNVSTDGVVVLLTVNIVK